MYDPGVMTSLFSSRFKISGVRGLETTVSRLCALTLLVAGCRLVPVEPQPSKDDSGDESKAEAASSKAEGSSVEMKTDGGGATKSAENSSEDPGKNEPDEKDGKEEGGKGDSEDKGPMPEGECRDGAKKECFETPDGDIILYPGSVPQGPCKVGIKMCEKNSWGPCLGAVGPKKMDTCEPGNDDNCNGKPTDHCACRAGETQDCGSNVGVCTKGTMTCGKDGLWGKECVGEVKPSKELCDGQDLDENCDGKPDSENCECVKGEVLACGRWTLGICKQGEYPCDDNGNWDKSECVGEVKPKTEICDGKGLDEDCDGLADLQDRTDCHCINGQVKECKVPGAVGDCSLGKQTCSRGRWSGCSSRFRPETEFCGSRQNPEPKFTSPTGDEDCDGQIDESDAGNRYMPRYGAKYMRDLDGDRWGAISQHAPIRLYCNINSARRDKYIPFDSDMQKDCGDCPAHLEGDKVHPGITDFFTSPSRCLRSLDWFGGKFDYNCSRRIETTKGLVTERFSCKTTSSGKCEGKTGWASDVKCGDHNAIWKPASLCNGAIDGNGVCMEDPHLQIGIEVVCH